MITLAQPDAPIFAALTCFRCQRTIDVLYPWMPRTDQAGNVTPFLASEVLCSGCRIGEAPAEHRALHPSRYASFRETRDRVGISSGTLLVQYQRFDDAAEWARDLAIVTYSAATREWPKPSPLKTLDLSAGTPPAVFVVLAAFVWADKAQQLKQLFWANWRSPKQDYRVETVGWNEPELKASDWARLTKMIRLFREFDPEEAWRPLSCYQRILATISALIAQGQEPSRSAVATTLYCYAPDPEDSVKKCLQRERDRSGRSTRWADVVRDAS